MWWVRQKIRTNFLRRGQWALLRKQLALQWRRPANGLDSLLRTCQKLGSPRWPFNGCHDWRPPVSRKNRPTLRLWSHSAWAGTPSTTRASLKGVPISHHQWNSFYHHSKKINSGLPPSEWFWTGIDGIDDDHYRYWHWWANSPRESAKKRWPCPNRKYRDSELICQQVRAYW